MTIRWGIIGCGDVCEVKSGPGFYKAGDSALVAVMRRDAAKAQDFARRHNVPAWYDNADALIGDDNVDAVYIATPVGTHAEYALKVCRAGKPCYVEKPMARNHAECRQMVQAFAAAGLPLFVAYYRRALPRFLKTRELIGGGAIGRLTGVTYCYSQPRHGTDGDTLPWRAVASASGGGFFMDLGSHTLDVIDFIAGPIASAAGAAANLASAYEVEDVVAMHWRHECGALGAGTWNFASHARQDLIEFWGTDGRISLSTFGNEPVRLEDARGVHQFDLPNPPHVQQPLIQTIVDELLGRGRCDSTSESAARTAAIMDAVLTDYYGGRDDAFWLRPQTWPGRRGR